MTKITPKLIKEAIAQEAVNLKRKRELYEQVVKINSEVRQLNEVGMTGSFGFANMPGDLATKSRTGFVDSFQNLSHIADLERRFGAETPTLQEDLMDEVARLRQENEDLKKSLAESKKSDKKEDKKSKTEKK